MSIRTRANAVRAQIQCPFGAVNRHIYAHSDSKHMHGPCSCHVHIAVLVEIRIHAKLCRVRVYTNRSMNIIGIHHLKAYAKAKHTDVYDLSTLLWSVH